MFSKRFRILQNQHKNCQLFEKHFVFKKVFEKISINSKYNVVVYDVFRRLS